MHLLIEVRGKFELMVLEKETVSSATLVFAMCVLWFVAGLFPRLFQPGAYMMCCFGYIFYLDTMLWLHLILFCL